MVDSVEEQATPTWEPLSTVDYSLLAVVGILQTCSLAICAHVIQWRKWPPYVTKSINLVVITTVSGILWTIAMIISVGYIRRDEGDILADCGFERFLSWSTLCTHTVAFFIRVYRMWRILIKHDNKMWHTEYQILFMSSVSLIPVVATWAVPDSGSFDEATNACVSTDFSRLVVVGMDALGFLAILFLWFVCARQLKWVRRQFNEYETMRRTLLNMTITLLSYVGVVLFLLDGDLVLQRRVSIFYPVMTTGILLWGSIREPFLNKMWGNTEYLLSFTKGFAELPSPAQLKASLAEQLSVDQLRDEFRRYIKTKVAQELVDFYLESLDREEMTGFFERQAVTMRIINQFIREDAPDQVNISAACRETILATDVTAYDIFDEARAEVLAVMETNFQREFLTTEGFRRIQDASEEEQRQMSLLRAGGMLAKLPTPSPSSPAKNLPVHSSPQLAVDTNGNLPLEPQTRPMQGATKIVDALKRVPAVLKNAKGSFDHRNRARVATERSADALDTGGTSNGCLGGKRSRSTLLKTDEEKGVMDAAASAEEEGLEGDHDSALARKLQGGEYGEDVRVRSSAWVLTHCTPAAAGTAKRAGERGKSVRDISWGLIPGDNNFKWGGADDLEQDGRGTESARVLSLKPFQAGFRGGEGTTSQQGSFLTSMNSTASFDTVQSHTSQLYRGRRGGGNFGGVKPESMHDLQRVGKCRNDSGDHEGSARSNDKELVDAPVSKPFKLGTALRWNNHRATASAAVMSPATGIPTARRQAESLPVSSLFQASNAKPLAESGATEMLDRTKIGDENRLGVVDTLPHSIELGGLHHPLSRQDGVEGLDGLPPVASEGSSEWIQFADWIQNGGQEHASQVMGGLCGRSGGEESLSAGGRLALMEEGFSPRTFGDGVGGCGGESSYREGRHSRSWCSEGSSWSNVMSSNDGSLDSFSETPGT